VVAVSRLALAPSSSNAAGALITATTAWTIIGEGNWLLPYRSAEERWYRHENGADANQNQAP
jgi:hypothetical protein